MTPAFLAKTRAALKQMGLIPQIWDGAHHRTQVPVPAARESPGPTFAHPHRQAAKGHDWPSCVTQTIWTKKPPAMDLPGAFWV